MRTTLSVMMGVSVLFVGTFALSEAGDQHKDNLSSSTAENASSVADGVFGGLLSGGGQGIIWFGVAAIILVSLGLLVGVSRGGGR